LLTRVAGQIAIALRNTGPAALTVAQVIVDDAVWPARYAPSPTISRLQSARIDLGYPWVEGERHEIKLVTTNGLIFSHEIPVAALSPQADQRSVFGFGIMGLYVGIVPVGLGLLWFPFLKRTGKATLSFVLALTVGLLAFLLVDTVAEGLEKAADLPGVFRGFPLLILGGVLSLLVLVAMGGGQRADTAQGSGRLRLAYLIAVGIGLHNLGEGLAIGAAFAAVEASLGTFLVIGFTLHNITEGVGIAAPMLRERPGLSHFLRLALVAGGPAILGTWLGAFAQAGYLTVVFFGIGAGAIAQVIYEVGKLLLKESDRAGNWLNVGGFAAGVAIMYLTALLVP
jgi:zinc transporter ZupT